MSVAGFAEGAGACDEVAAARDAVWVGVALLTGGRAGFAGAGAWCWCCAMFMPGIDWAWAATGAASAVAARTCLSMWCSDRGGSGDVDERGRAPNVVLGCLPQGGVRLSPAPIRRTAAEEAPVRLPARSCRPTASRRARSKREGRHRSGHGPDRLVPGTRRRHSSRPWHACRVWPTCRCSGTREPPAPPEWRPSPRTRRPAAGRARSRAAPQAGGERRTAIGAGAASYL